MATTLLAFDVFVDIFYVRDHAQKGTVTMSYLVLLRGKLVLLSLLGLWLLLRRVLR